MEAEAMFEYTAVEDDELTLKVGDVITDIKKNDEGWCEGILRGRRGVFPDNFVQIRPVKSVLPPEMPKAVLPPEIPKAVLPFDIPKAVLPEMRGMESKAKARRAKVAYSYAAENPDELTLAPGQVVDIIAEEETGWWRGALGGKIGVFPSNFVEEIADEPKPEPQIVKLPQADGRLPISVAPVSVNEKPPVAPQDTRIDETDVPSMDVPKIGLRVMPGFDPSKVKLKPAGGVLPVAPPPSADPRKTAKEKAKVIADHIATRPEELDVKVGDIVDVIRKDSVPGFWEVLMGDKSGIIPDNAAEMLTAVKKPPLKEPPKLPVKKVAESPKIAVIQESDQSSSELTESFGVPRTTPLDTTAMQNRPKHMGRPPSTAKLPGIEIPVDSTPVAPWQDEMKKRVRPPHPPPPGAAGPGPAAPPPSVAAVAPPPVSTKPKPPAVKVDTKAPQPALSSDKVVDKFEQDKPQDKLVTNSPVPSDDASKDALEKIEKLSEALEKFKGEMMDKFEKQRAQYRREIDTLTHDLDEERKKHAATQIEVDRLKKSVADLRDK